MISSCRCIYCIECSIKSTENGCKVNGHYQRNKKMLDKIATHHFSRMKKEQDADRKKISMEINEREKRSRSKKEKLAELENELLRLKAMAKSKNVNPLKKDTSSREKRTKNPCTSNYLVQGGDTSPPIYNTHKKTQSPRSSFPWNFGKLF